MFFDTAVVDIIVISLPSSSPEGEKKKGGGG